jgi:hypothetical protein
MAGYIFASARCQSVSRGTIMSHSVVRERPIPPFRVTEMGFRLFYHRNSVNHCPGCGQTQWYIGRVSAECAFCATALPLQEIVSRDSRPVCHLGLSQESRYRAQPV